MTIYSKSNPPHGFYVYACFREDGTPYYIGKGSSGRAWKKHKTEVCPPKNNDHIVIVSTNLTEMWSFILERRLIKWYGRKDNGTGILRNKTDGGEGSSGLQKTEEWCKNHSTMMKAIMVGKPSPMQGKKNSAEHIEKRMAAHIGKKRTIDTCNKISESRKGVSTPHSKITCPHCGKHGGSANMKRYHFNNCTKYTL
jgi:hypothetical protein